MWKPCEEDHYPMNKTYFLGVEIETNLPNSLMEKLINLACKDSETYQMLSEWHNRVIKNWNKDEIVKISISESNYERPNTQGRKETER